MDADYNLFLIRCQVLWALLLKKWYFISFLKGQLIDIRHTFKQDLTLMGILAFCTI